MSVRTLLPLLMFAGFAVVFLVVLSLVVSTSRKARDNMIRLAGKLGLTLKESKSVLGICRAPEAAGTIRGKFVRLYTYTTSSGKNSDTWAALAVEPAVPGKLTFALTRQGLATKLMEVFGAHEVKVGDAAFDREWFVQTNAPEFFVAALLPELQAKLRPLAGKWELKNSRVTYVERGTFADARRCDRFGATVDAACDLADVAEVYAQQPGQS
ncbi:MAG: hypothetical protein ACHQ4G_05640 [Opitutales bacterium]